MVLDHLDQIVRPEENAERHFDTSMALAGLGEGLCWLHQNVAPLEREA